MKTPTPRRRFAPIVAGLLWLVAAAGAAVPPPATTAEQWGIWELGLEGPAGGNPFTEVELSAQFSQEAATLTARGFYDGNGVYRVRFMPEATGTWRYRTKSNRPELDGKSGSLVVTPPRAGNHGPVRVRNTFHFAHADGTPTADWDHYFQIVVADDPYRHLRAIHNGFRLYDNNKAWVTHSSIQNGGAVVDYGRAQIFRDVYNKPVVFDEVKYEGDIPQRFGALTAEQMVLRFWQGTVAGTYVTHGETYLDPNDVLWWAKGGVLKGQSPARITFLRKILEEGPPNGLDPIDKWQDNPFAGVRGRYYLGYLGTAAPTAWKFEL